MHVISRIQQMLKKYLTHQILLDLNKKFCLTKLYSQAMFVQTNYNNLMNSTNIMLKHGHITGSIQYFILCVSYLISAIKHVFLLYKTLSETIRFTQPAYTLSRFSRQFLCQWTISFLNHLNLPEFMLHFINQVYLSSLLVMLALFFCLFSFFVLTKFV